ncbi:MAG: amylo-alpha-1,6-glucosidase [Ktedonobacteraceae bacterium]
MPITLDRSICCDLQETISREWLITNGIGAYASGTVAGVLTRMEHGLLVACPQESTIPHLFLAKIDEEVVFDQRTYYLGTNEYRDGILNPSGFVHLETFRLEEGFPIFTYRLGGIDGIMLEKRIWMQQGRDTTYIQYRVIRTTTADETGHRRSGFTGALSNTTSRTTEFNASVEQPITLTLLPYTAYRPHNQAQHGNNDWHFQVQQYQHNAEKILGGNGSGHTVLLPAGVTGCTIHAWENAHPYHLLAVGQPASEAAFIPTNVWYWNFLRRRDAATGKPALDDLYLPGVIRATLWPTEGSTLTIMVSTEELATQTLHPNQLVHSYRRSVEGQTQLLANAVTAQRYFGEGGEAARVQRLSVLPLSTTSAQPHIEDEAFLRSLLHACERFLLQRKLPGTDKRGNHELLFGRSEHIPDVLSDFYSMERRTRDTLIALPGIVIATGRFSEIAPIFRDLAHTFKQGMLPETLPLPGNSSTEHVYQGADLLLWYCYALDHYLGMSQDYELLDELYPYLVANIHWYIQGNEYGVKMDTDDGLLVLSRRATTWMNAYRGGSAVTARRGKPVELNALWYNALSLLHEWSQRLAYTGQVTRTTVPYKELLMRCQASFQQKFWYADGGYLFDVIDSPNGNDSALRPNQLFACSLRYPVATKEQRASILGVVAKKLLTPYGLRTLAPDAKAYHGTLGVRQEEQQDAVHQGSIWTWLLGPYIDALYNATYTQSYDEMIWKKSLRQLAPYNKQLSEGMLGMIGGVFDGNYPHTAGYTPATLLGSTELLRVYHTLTQVHVRQPHLVQSR